MALNSDPAVADYDAIVIGAGHNGLTAAAVMARGGMRVLCLEKNQFTGGMASTTELIRGYRFELAGSVQFPVPNEIYDDLGFDVCPIFEPDVRSASISDGGEAPMIFHTDPDRLVEHLSDHLGLDAVMGLAEIMNWAQAPGRALGRYEVRTPPKTLDEMFACATNEAEREAIRTATVRHCHGRHRPLPPGPGAPRPDARRAAGIPVGELHLPRAVHAGERPVHGVRWRHPGRTPPCRRSAAASEPCPITSSRCSKTAAGSSAGTRCGADPRGRRPCAWGRARRR